MNALNFGQFAGRALCVFLSLTINGEMGWRRIWLCLCSTPMHLGSSFLLKCSTDHVCSSVSRQLGSFCPMRKDPCTHLFLSLSVLQLHSSSRMLSTKQIKTLFRTLYLQGPLGTALRLPHRQLLEAQPKCLSNGESFEFKSRYY